MIFVTDWAQKTSLTKLVLKSSVLKQSLPNSQHKLLYTSQYEVGSAIKNMGLFSKIPIDFKIETRDL